MAASSPNAKFATYPRLCPYQFDLLQPIVASYHATLTKHQQEALGGVILDLGLPSITLWDRATIHLLLSNYSDLLKFLPGDNASIKTQVRLGLALIEENCCDRCVRWHEEMLANEWRVVEWGVRLEEMKNRNLRSRESKVAHDAVEKDTLDAAADSVDENPI